MKTYLMKPIRHPGSKNKWMVTELTNGKVTTAWGFVHWEDAENHCHKLEGIQPVD